MNSKFKKNILLLFVLCICSIFSIKSINASYAYTWTVNGESMIRNNSTNSTKTATWSEDNTYSGGVLTLNNYNGGQLTLKCAGTGLPNQVFAIKLIGDNKVTVENGTGIESNSPIVFIGDGTLTINAPTPISSEIQGISTAVTIKPSVKIIDNSTSNNTNTNTNTNSTNEISNNTVNTETNANSNNENKTTDKIENKDTDKTFIEKNSFIISIVSGTYFIISLIILIILIVKLNKKVNE